MPKKRDERYDRFVRPLDEKRDRLAGDVARRRGATTGGQHAEVSWILGAIPTINAVKDGVRYVVPGSKA